MMTVAKASAVLFAAVVAAACASSTPSAGVPNTQAQSACLSRGAACVLSTDCCTQFCANRVCVVYR